MAIPIALVQNEGFLINLEKEKKMKKKFLLGLVTVLSFFLLSGMSQAVLIDFDTLPDGSQLPTHSVLTNQYSAWGVSFTGFENGVEQSTYVDTYWGSAPAPAGGDYWSNMLPDNADNWGNVRRDVLRVSFTQAANNIGFDFFNCHGSLDITIKFYNASGFIASEIISTSGWQPVSFSYSNVSYFDMFQPRDDWGYTVDNLYFEPVPEPTTMLLLGSGLIGLAGFRKKFKKG